MRKRYFSYKNGLLVPISLNGNTIYPKFSWNYITKRGEFLTSDKKLQNAIEDTVFFKKGFIKADPYTQEEVVEIHEESELEETLEKEESSIEEPMSDIPVTPIIKLEEVLTANDAKKYLISVGIDPFECKTLTQIRALAKKNKIKFPNL
jgi:hypothetical protein